MLLPGIINALCPAARFFSPKAWKSPEERGEIFHAEGENGAEGMRFYYREYHILFSISTEGK